MSTELIRRARVVVEIDTNKREIREELDLDAEAGETIEELLTRVRDVFALAARAAPGVPLGQWS